MEAARKGSRIPPRILPKRSEPGAAPLPSAGIPGAGSGPFTWCTKTSTGESRVAPPLAVMERKPKPMRTLNHLQMPEPCRGWGSFSALGESPSGSSPGFAPGESPTQPLSRGAGGNRGVPVPPAQPEEPQILAQGSSKTRQRKKSPKKSTPTSSALLALVLGNHPASGGNEGRSCRHGPGGAWGAGERNPFSLIKNITNQKTNKQNPSKHPQIITTQRDPN